MGINKQGLAWIVVSDLKKARKFFVETMGLQETCFSEEFNWLELKGKDDDDTTFGICSESPHSPVQAGQNAVVTFTVDNVENSKKELSKKGVKFVGDIMEVPGHVKLLMFQDEDGNYFQLCEKIGF